MLKLWMFRFSTSDFFGGVYDTTLKVRVMLITEDYLNKSGRKIYLYLQKGNQWKFGHEITKQSAKNGTGTSQRNIWHW